MYCIFFVRLACLSDPRKRHDVYRYGLMSIYRKVRCLRPAGYYYITRAFVSRERDWSFGDLRQTCVHFGTTSFPKLITTRDVRFICFIIIDVIQGDQNFVFEKQWEYNILIYWCIPTNSQRFCNMKFWSRCIIIFFLRIILLYIIILRLSRVHKNFLRGGYSIYYYYAREWW